MAVYLLAYRRLHASFGAAATAFTIFPVIAAGWLFGQKAGFLASPLILLIEMLVKSVTGWKDSDPISREWEFVGVVILFLMGWFAGVARSFKERMQQELSDRIQSEQALKRSEQRYRCLFEASPISLWEEDFSAVKRAIDSLRAQGVKDFRSYFQDHPAEVARCLSLVKILDVNQATVRLYGAACKADLLSSLDLIIPPNAHHLFINELVYISEGCTDVEWEGLNRTLSGDELDVIVHWSAAPGCEQNLSSVFVSLQDITARKKAEQDLRESEIRFRQAIEHSPSPIFSIDRDGKIQSWNAACVSFFQYGTEIVGQPLSTLLSGYDEQLELESMSGQVFQNQLFDGIEIKFLRKDGSEKYTVSQMYPALNDDKKVVGCVFGITDISDRKLMEIELRNRESYITQLKDLTQVALETSDFNVLLQSSADRMGALLGADGCYITLWDAEKREATPAAASGALSAEFYSSRLLPGEVSLVTSVLQAGHSLVAEDAGHSTYISPRQATIFPARSQLGLPLIADERLLGMVLIAYLQPHHFSPLELSLGEQAAAQIALAIDKAQLYAELQQRAITDPLTGLYNRRGLFELGRREVERARRYNRALSAIMVDIDHFKLVNDTFGHDAGDQALLALVDCCRKNVRDTDIVGRYGGEEFVILLPESTCASARRVAERLRLCICNNAVATAQGEVRITVSIGVSEATQDTVDLADLINAADAALYAAKQTGRNKVAVVTS